MNTPLSLGSMFTNIITNPAVVFDSIKLKTSFMVPLMITLILTALMLVMYFQQVDPVWYVDHIIAISGNDMAPDEIAQMRKMLKPENMMIIGAVGAVIGILVIFLVQALYLLIVGNIKNIDASFGEWFSVSVWSSVPGILLGIMIIINLLISDNSQLAPELLNPLNFASLFGIEAPGNLYNLMAGLSVVTFWGIYLIVVGFKRWSALSWTASTLIVSLPYLVIWSAQLFLF